jgi:hypothetical protein
MPAHTPGVVVAVAADIEDRLATVAVQVDWYEATAVDGYVLFTEYRGNRPSRPSV